MQTEDSSEAGMRLRTVLQAYDLIPDPILVLTLDAQIVYLNPPAERLFNCHAREIVSRRIFELLDGSEEAQMKAKCQDLKTGKSESVVLDAQLSSHVVDGPLSLHFALSAGQVGEESFIVATIAVEANVRSDRDLELERFRTAIDSTGDGLFIFDIEAERFLFVNKTACDRLGYTLDEMTSMHPIILNPENTQEVLLEMQKTITESSENQVVFEVVHFRKDGSSYPVEMVLQVMKDDPSIIVAAERDMTQRNKAEEEIHLFRAAMDGAADSIFIVDAETHLLIDANCTASEELGYEREELIGQSPTLINPELSVERVASIHEGARGERESSQVHETVHKRKDGTTFPVEISLRPLDLSGRSILVVSARDITQRKVSEQALIRSEAKLTTMSEVAPIGIAVQGIDGLFTYANKTILDAVGLERKESLGETEFWREHLHEDDRDRVIDGLTNWHGSTALFRTEYRYLHPTIGEQEHLLMLAPIFTEGEITDYAVVLHDITEERQVAHELELARDQAEGANKAKSEFLSRMSHELRTPLNAILGFAQILEADSDSEEEKASIKHILDGGQHLLGLINEVLDISRIDTGSSDMRIEPVDVAAAVRQTIGLMAGIANENDVRVRAVSWPESDIFVLADNKRLQQILINVVSNAIKYNKRGGSVEIAWTESNGSCVFNISDTGIGIAEEDLGRLFVPFDRLGAENSGVEGVGLGLALTSKLVAALDGEIKYESIVGTGTTVMVTLPLSASSTRATIEAEDSKNELRDLTNETKNVLLVEDNQSNVQMIQRIFRDQTSWTLEVCMTGEEALETFNDVLPDVVLLDVNLPRMSGTEVLVRLRSQPDTFSVPVVMLSAIADKDSIAGAIRMGADRYLTKPLNVAELLHTLSEVMEPK